MKLKDLGYYFDGGSYHIRLTNGKQFVVDNGFGDIVGGVKDKNGRYISGDFFNPTKHHLFADGHPHNKESRIANQGEVNKVLSVMLRAAGLKVNVEGKISIEKYEMINTLCGLLYGKYRRRYGDYDE